ncbi:helix-turn-helix domain-containing protein [Thalassotalea piscium]
MTEFFIHFAIAQMVFCILVLLPQQHKNPSIRLFIVLMCCGVTYCLGDIHPEIVTYSLFWWISHIGGNILPGAFWLVSLSVFGDHTRLKLWQYGLASLTLLIPLIFQVMHFSLELTAESEQVIGGFFSQTATVLELGLIIHALIVASQHWRDDLVQERRYIRGGVISLSAIYLILKIVMDELLDIQWQGMDIISSFLLMALITGINFFLFQLKTSSLFETVNVATQKAPQNKKRSKELLTIVESMAEDKLYQQDGLTIAGLAKHLGIHEYKLRNLINGELNYRNFNDFLNYYRILEVSEKLVDSEFSSTPVLTLALESGFRSLSSFNKAFKATHGQTPTEFRKNHLSAHQN